MKPGRIPSRFFSRFPQKVRVTADFKDVENVKTPVDDGPG